MGQCLQILLLNAFLLLYQNKCKQPELQNKCAFTCHSENKYKWSIKKKKIKYKHAEICCNNIEHVGIISCLFCLKRVSEWLLFNANSAIYRLYGENKLIFNEMFEKGPKWNYKQWIEHKNGFNLKKNMHMTKYLL